MSTASSTTMNGSPDFVTSLALLKNELTPEEMLEVDQHLAALNVPTWEPMYGPQTLAYHSLADELFYGGAAGGGKSDLLLGLGLTAHRKTLLLRRQATQLPELTERCKALAAGRGDWRGSGHGGVMTMHDGRRVELAGCDHPDDRQKYKGRAHDLKAFDELSDFPEDVYTFICAWNRTTAPGQRCRRVGAGNPPSTAEGEWVVRRWAPWLDAGWPRKALPGELRWYAMAAGEEIERENGEPFDFKGERLIPWSRTFIPAMLADNPILMATGYGRVLNALPEPLRSQLLKGDFSASRIDDPWQVIPSEWVRAAQDRWYDYDEDKMRLSAVGLDPARGGMDRTAISKRYRNWFAPLEMHAGKQTPDGDIVAELVVRSMESRFPQDLQARVNIDAIGVGAACVDACRRRRLNVVPIVFSEGCPLRDRSDVMEFANLRAYAYWALRDALDPVNGDDLALPPDPELLADLTAPKWEARSGGVIVEEKKKIKERIGRSPDRGDAVVLANLQWLGVDGDDTPIVHGSRSV